MSEHLNSDFVPQQYDVFAGLDVDKTSVAITFMSHQGFLKSLRIPYGIEPLLNYVRKHFCSQKVAFAYEAGPTGYGIYDGLTQQGHPCLVAAASMVPKAPGQRVKTNRLDSKAICEALRGGQLKSIHVPSQSYRQLRHLTQLRDTFIRQVAAAKYRIKALLLFEGIPFPPAPPTSQWSFMVLAQLRKLACSETVRFKLDRLLQSLEFSQKQALETMREIRRLCLKDVELCCSIRYLMTIPGIGWIVASQLLARIGDYRQIENVRQLAAFVGVVPTEHSTGDAMARGSITRLGDSRLRSKLIQGAWSAIRKDPELRAFYRSVYQRHPRDRAARKAIVAVARKLTTRIYAVLKEQRPYVIRQAHSAPLTQEETVPQGTTRRCAEPRDEQSPSKVRSSRQRARGTVAQGGPNLKEV